jgi:lipopolysaccharide/colanic/teichoic acid biosynthesis glycosyltransferase
VAIASSWWTRGGKRSFDVATVLALAVVLLPVALLCALLVRLIDGPPAVFRQTRIGLGGRPFEILKLRTMRPGEGPPVTSASDPRITPLGRRLRAAKLDEVPQLWNVLRGEMSLVGPRPEVPRYAATQPRGFRAIAGLRPGLTDWASLIFHDEEFVLARHGGQPEFYQRRLLPRKLALARLYHRRQSCGADLGVLAGTGCLVLGLDGGVLLGRRFVARAREGM